MAASKAESQKIFEKLKTKPANKVRILPLVYHTWLFPPSLDEDVTDSVRIGLLRLWHQEPYVVVGSVGYLLVFGLFVQPSKPGGSYLLCPFYESRPYADYSPPPKDMLVNELVDKDVLLIVGVFDAEWQWEQLRLMKVGGNESATKYFQSNGGSAALASKDAKVKYTCNAATKYKDELKRRAAADAQQSVYSLFVLMLW